MYCPRRSSSTSPPFTKIAFRISKLPLASKLASQVPPSGTQNLTCAHVLHTPFEHVIESPLSSTLEEAAILHICVKDWRAWSTVDSSDQYVLLRGEFPLKELLESAAASNDYSERCFKRSSLAANQSTTAFPLYLQKPGGVEGHFILLRFHAVSSTVSYPLLRVRHMQSAEPVASSRWIAPNPTYRHSGA